MRLLRAVAAFLLLRSAGAVLSHTAVAVCMALLWLDPMVFGPDVAEDLLYMLILEFIALHSTAFLVAFRWMKGFPRWVFILFYAPFVLAVASMMSSAWVGIAFLWHLASGVWSDFDTAERAVERFVARYVPTFAWFILLPYPIVLFGLPPLGWEAHPSLALETDQGFSSLALVPAWTTLYFAGRAVWEILVRWWERTGDLDRFFRKLRST